MILKFSQFYSNMTFKYSHCIELYVINQLYKSICYKIYVYQFEVGESCFYMHPN